MDKDPKRVLEFLRSERRVAVSRGNLSLAENSVNVNILSRRPKWGKVALRRNAHQWDLIPSPSKTVAGMIYGLNEGPASRKKVGSKNKTRKKRTKREETEGRDR